jgi:hypothetical protein
MARLPVKRKVVQGGGAENLQEKAFSVNHIIVDPEKAFIYKK